MFHCLLHYDGGKHSELLHAFNVFGLQMLKDVEHHLNIVVSHRNTISLLTKQLYHVAPFFIRLSVDSGAVHIIAQTTIMLQKDKKQVNEQNILSMKHLNSKEQQKQPKISRVGTFDCEKKIM